MYVMWQKSPKAQYLKVNIMANMRKNVIFIIFFPYILSADEDRCIDLARPPQLNMKNWKQTAQRIGRLLQISNQVDMLQSFIAPKLPLEAK